MDEERQDLPEEEIVPEAEEKLAEEVSEEAAPAEELLDEAAPEVEALAGDVVAEDAPLMEEDSDEVAPESELLDDEAASEDTPLMEDTPEEAALGLEASAEDVASKDALLLKEFLADAAPEIEVPVEEAASEDAPAEDEILETQNAYSEEEDGRLWYVVHCYSGYENKVLHNLEQRIETMGMKSLIFDVVVPTEEEIEVKDGKRRTLERRVFPGYILVNMIMTEESWYVVRNTPGVTSFVGMGNEPVPLRPEKVSSIIKRMEADAPRIKVTFKPGERVRIVDGPFNDFRGTVDEIDMEKAKVRVMVSFFGRETPVELDFLQVEKA